MTQEDINLMYQENTYNMYIFKLNEKDVLRELLNFNVLHPTSTMLVIYTNQEGLDKSNKIFDLSYVSIHLYYKSREISLREEIASNTILNKKWIDSDCFDLVNDKIEKLKKETLKTRRKILKLLEYNNDFIKMIVS